MKTPAKVELHFKVIQESDGFTATCDELPGLVTCAPSIPRLLLPMINDAVRGWFDTLKQRGKIGEVLSSLGADPESDTVLFSPVLHGDAEEIRYDLRASCG